VKEGPPLNIKRSHTPAIVRNKFRKALLGTEEPV
jgi:hypothetical protein